MSNKVNAIKALGVAVAAAVESIDNNGGKSYFLRPGDKYMPGRDSGKQALAIQLAARPQGVSLERLTSALSETGKKYDVAAAKSYLSKDFAGRKGLGVYWRAMSVAAYLGQFGESDAKRERQALRDSQRRAADTSGVVVMHVWHGDANVGRAPQAADFVADGQAAALLGMGNDAPAADSGEQKADSKPADSGEQKADSKPAPQSQGKASRKARKGKGRK